MEIKVSDELDLFDVAKDAQPVPRDEQLLKLSKLAQQQIEAEDYVANLEEQLKKAKENQRFISEVQVPEMMSALGVDEFKLTSGFKITVKPWFSGKITDENAEEAYNWLEEHGHGSIVKHDMTVQVRMTDSAKLERIKILAESLGLDIKEKFGVHYMTLSAFIKEQVNSGEEIPRELLGVTQGLRAKIGR